MAERWIWARRSLNASIFSQAGSTNVVSQKEHGDMQPIGRVRGGERCGGLVLGSDWSDDAPRSEVATQTAAATSQVARDRPVIELAYRVLSHAAVTILWVKD